MKSLMIKKKNKRKQINLYAINLYAIFIYPMSSSSSSSSSSSDSDDDDSVKQRRNEKRRAKTVRRESRSKLEEEKEREARSREVKRRREYLEMKKKKEMYQRFLLEKKRNPNKEPLTVMIAETRNNRIKKNASRTAKKTWYNMSPPRSYIEHGERQSVTPSLKDWREMLSKKGGKTRRKK